MRNFHTNYAMIFAYWFLYKCEYVYTNTPCAYANRTGRRSVLETKCHYCCFFCTFFFTSYYYFDLDSVAYFVKRVTCTYTRTIYTYAYVRKFSDWRKLNVDEIGRPIVIAKQVA